MFLGKCFLVILDEVNHKMYEAWKLLIVKK